LADWLIGISADWKIKIDWLIGRSEDCFLIGRLADWMIGRLVN